MFGRTAYLRGWPLVNGGNRGATFAKAPVIGFSGVRSFSTGKLCLA
jgi:hypothetical protein